jgi:hypothetical protein
VLKGGGGHPRSLNVNVVKMERKKMCLESRALSSSGVTVRCYVTILESSSCRCWVLALYSSYGEVAVC